ncbi:MAG: PqqD family protein [Candidatus Marinimicrobia bacterium]|nr:PqqD family protein [Candidatus Neomarinimicrobiota bacterium]MBT3633263.1 PqqD family protein [Candidatus Neomarinimicrobiota bacterium]MBT3682136.1 PqqD family protein [Candidatus Neomarinimicrobiota bacterium]MBT3758863.1 PqqD family protein [Candidatus Neomarinimicrobiota bacterium]MBT3895262.1 PqqD family protein [Candidatus Neomarinimicrobiota bacterium]
MPELFKSELTLSDSGFLFDHNSGLTYTLNVTGQFIFNCMEDGLQAVDILGKIMKEFEVNEDTARKDMDDFYRQLTDMGLISK